MTLNPEFLAVWPYIAGSLAIGFGLGILYRHSWDRRS